MKSDAKIKRDVEAALQWEPDIDPTDVAVAVKDRVVTLTGFVRSYREKLDAEAATKRIAGVVGVANDIEVRVPEVDARPDPEIARDAVAALQKELPAWAQRLKVLVTKGWVTLEGELEWNYQRDIAETAIRRIRGVRNVTNKIALKPTVVASDIKRKIEEAFERSAQIDASGVMVEANGSEVILKGRVRTWAERQEAERAAWAAAGVTKVDNQIKITG